MKKPIALIERIWYQNHFMKWGLWPISWLYQLIVGLRRWYLLRFKHRKFSVPVIVVGNLSVGGTGKTPLVITLARELSTYGKRVGIVSRGYGSLIKHFPYLVREDDHPRKVGDEPLLLARKTQCPVVIAPQRAQAVQYLIDKHQCEVIISDDGLQHYAMGRTMEIAVVDAGRGFGNGLCLPAGPLREKLSRLSHVDLVVVHGSNNKIIERLNTMCERYKIPLCKMQLIPGGLTQLTTGRVVPVEDLQQPIGAIAAIGHPERFFATLRALNMDFNSYRFADHHPFQAKDLPIKEKSIVMTEKDAVKCVVFATDNMYFLPVEARVCDKFWELLWSHEQL